MKIIWNHDENAITVGEGMKKAFITGITGQDGSFLTELLLANGYEVHGMMRRSSSFNTGRIDHVFKHPYLHLHYGDMLDPCRLGDLLQEIKPDEVYNLAAQSNVALSFEQPAYTAEVVGQGTLNLLEAVMRHCPICRFYQASSSEMFGGWACPLGGYTEASRFDPQSPYAAAKVFAHQMVGVYRASYGLKASCGILFNHESERRGETFVTRKITRAATRISLGLQDTLVLGNLEAYRDWGFAGDYVEAMWLMLQSDVEPGDYVIATGESVTVKEFCSRVFKKVGISKECIQRDDRLYRPREVPYLLGNSAKARGDLKWRPLIGLDALIDRMIEHDMTLARKELRDKEEGSEGH